MNHTHIIKFNCLTGFLNWYNNNVRVLDDVEYEALIDSVVKDDFVKLDDVLIVRDGDLTAYSPVKLNYVEGS